MIVALHILNDIKPSGMEKMLESSFMEWGKNGHEIVVLGAGSNHTFAHTLQAKGYEVILIPKIRSVLGFVYLFRTFRRVRPKIVHNHSESCHGYIALLSRITLPKSPIVRTIHNCFRFSGKNKLHRKFQHLIESSVGVFRVSCGKDVQVNELLEWKVSSQLVENWIDTARFTQIDLIDSKKHSDADIVVAIVGNCSPIKDHAFALEILMEFDEIKVLHVGDQQYITQSERAILNLLIQSKSLLHDGPSDRVEHIFSKSDVHILSSTHEGMALVVAESISLGIETWIRDVPGVQWARGIPGVRFFKTQEDLRELLREKTVLKQKFEMPVDQKKLLVERFSPNRGVREYSEIYLSLLSN